MDPLEVMRRALAAHGRGVTEDGSIIFVGGVHASPHVAQVNRHGSVAVVELQLGLHAGPFGDRWVFERWGSIGETVEEAIVEGVHEWLLVPYRALERALDGSEPSFRGELHGAPIRLYADDIMLRGDGGVRGIVAQLRGGSPCAQVLARPDLLPLLAPGRAHLVTCFAARPGEGAPLVEVSIDGAPWPPATRALSEVRWPDQVTYASFRQTAMLFADGAPRIDRPSLAATWAGLAARDPGLEGFGASEHRYQLAPPLTLGDLGRLRNAGVELPEDFAAFVSEVAGFGAGPYRGLLPPHAPSQLVTACGFFPHAAAWPVADAHEDDDALVAGTLALCHLGCGYFHMLVINGPARGQVWADLRYAGGGLVPTHPSFTSWYLDGLDAAVRGQLPQTPGAPDGCALPRALSSFANELSRSDPERDLKEALAELGPGAIRTVAEGTSQRFDAGDPLGLCPHCVELADRLEVPRHAFVPGVLPKPARELRT